MTRTKMTRKKQQTNVINDTTKAARKLWGKNVVRTKG